MLNNFSEACPMFHRFSPPLDKFNLPIPEQSHYDVIRTLIAWSLASQGYLPSGTKHFCIFTNKNCRVSSAK